MLVYARKLTEGRALTQLEIEELAHEDILERAYAAALNFLSYRPRSRREVADYFRRKKTDPNVSEAVMERLDRLGVLDDREFARFWLDNRQRFRPRGTRALRVEMRRKGLDTEVIEEALATIDDEYALACEAGARKVRSFESLPEDEFRRKMLAFLQRRGFGYDVAAEATKTLLESRDQAS